MTKFASGSDNDYLQTTPMRKISFKNDYSEGAHPAILNMLVETNPVQQEGYGCDDYCMQAAELIREQTGQPDAQVCFITGGTQTNMLVISHLLRPYESVIAAESGHIAVHEAGAIESTGHKINTIPAMDGKVTAEGLRETMEAHTDEHMVKPAMVYLSQSTELGTIYSKSELTTLSEYCREHGLLLYIDGARLGMALTARENDLTLSDIARLTDVFYIGGTKNGALLGEAVVFIRPGADTGFRYHVKQKGALLAKGRILGIQFLSLFREGLFFDLAAHANHMAAKIARSFAEKGFGFYLRPQTNQVFPILPNAVIEEIGKEFDFYLWKKIDDRHTAVRIVTSWATKEVNVDRFIARVADCEALHPTP